MRTCSECADASDPSRNGAGDGRVILVGNIMEYSVYLQDKHSE